MNKSSIDAWHANEKDPTLEFQLRVQAAQQMQGNAELRQQRAARLDRDGGFRIPEGQLKRGFRRGFKPIWSGKVHEVQELTGDGMVKDEEGHMYPTRIVLPVPLESDEVDVGEAVRSGSATQDAAIIKQYQKFVGPIRMFIAKNGGVAQLSIVTKYARNELGMVFPKVKPTASKIMLLLGLHIRTNQNVTYVSTRPA